MFAMNLENFLRLAGAAAALAISAAGQATGPSTASTSAAAPAAPGKPHVFITDSESWERSRGSEGGAAAARTQTAEVMISFADRCPDVTVNERQQEADYIVILDHQGKQYWRYRNQVAVIAPVFGVVVIGHSTDSLTASIADACFGIVENWAAHGREMAAERERAGAGAQPANERHANPEEGDEQGKDQRGKDRQDKDRQDKDRQDTPRQDGNRPDAKPPDASKFGGKEPDAALPATARPEPSPAASVTIDSTPGEAEIEIDGAFVGDTPSTVLVAPGNHRVTVRKRGFAAWTRKLTVTGGAVHLKARLEARPRS